MTREDLFYLSPLLIIAAAPALMMLVVAVIRTYKVIYGFSLIALLVAMLPLFLANPDVSHSIPPLFIFDGYSSLFSGIILLSSLFVTYLSYRFIRHQESEKEEYFIVLFTAVLGSLILAASSHFISLFLGLETLSISLYILIAYRRSRRNSIEAAVKYLILASVSSAFLLFGMGLIYLDTGSLEFSAIAVKIASPGHPVPLFLTGFCLMIVGIGFKLALVPFHMWISDVYEGAPVPVTTFIATVSKGAVMAVFLRFFYTLEGFRNEHFILLVTVIGVVTMFIGNLLAVRQQSLRRILAYSSISNMGYLLIPFLTGSREGLSAAIFYLIAYMITTLGAFGVISLLSDRDYDADHLEDYSGLFWKRPWVAVVLTLSMLSLAGIPLTAGFMSKFYLVYTGIHSDLWILVVSLIINSVIGLYYYLRVITTLFSPANDRTFPSTSSSGIIFLFTIALGIVWLGLNPDTAFHFIRLFTGL